MGSVNGLMHTPEHAGDIIPRAEEGLEESCPALVHAYNCTRNAATGFSPSYGREPKLPVDVECGLQRRSHKGSLGESNHVSQLKWRLRFVHKKAKHMAKRQQDKHRELYDQKCRGA